jgi:hypothetical protein
MKFDKLDPIFGDRDDSKLYRLMQITTLFTGGYCYGKIGVYLTWIVPGEWFKVSIALIFLSGVGIFYVYCKSSDRLFIPAAIGLLIGGVVMSSWLV